MYQVKEQRGPKLKEEEALSGVTFDGVIIAILISYLNFLRLLPLSPQKYFCLSQNHAVELGLADSLFSSMKVTFIHIYSCPIYKIFTQLASDQDLILERDVTRPERRSRPKCKEIQSMQQQICLD